MGRLDGKVALITGAAGGQGEAESRLFVEEGARVMMCDIADGQGKSIAESLGSSAAYLHHDVTQEESWARAVSATTDAFGRLDILINNAGIVHVATIAEIALEDYMRVIQVNQVGCLLGMKTAIPAMMRAGGGSIINISSTLGFEGAAGVVAYVASKFAIRGMTKTAALELGALNIRVNSIHPGGIDTPMGRGDSPEFSAVDTEAVYGSLPIARIGKPIEVARLSVYLGSDESSYSTGSEFMLDGGMLAGNSSVKKAAWREPA